MSFAAESVWLAAAAALALFGLAGGTARLVPLIILSGLTVGLWRGANEQKQLAHYEPFVGQIVVLEGQVSEDVSKKKSETRMQLSAIRVNGTPLHGKVWLSTETSHAIKRNDKLQLEGKLEEGFGNLAASMTGATLIGLQPTSSEDKALQLRDWFADGVRKAIPEPQASLGSGFLTGQHSTLPEELDEQLRVVGLTHAVVASGSNLTILVGFMRRAFMRVSKYTATLAGSLMTAGFVMVAGLSPSMTRAGLVTGLSLAAWYYGRRIHPLVLLPFAAAITVIANPSFIWGDIGWYLSFGAFAGVLILAPLMQTYFWGKDYKPNIMMEIFIGTTAAQIATMPVILFSFGTYSSYALLANMLVLPLVPLAMLLTFIGGIAGLAVPAIAQIVGWPAAIVMQYMTAVIDWVANLPGAQGEIIYNQAALAISYVAMAAACVYMWRVTSHRFRQGSNILIGERA
jgi:competence protein ComEC